MLRDIGLPQTQLPTALLFFNIGVEIGQILFVLALVAAFLVTRPLLKRLLSAQDHEVHWTWITTPASYLIGGVASYWLIDRITHSLSACLDSSGKSSLIQTPPSPC